MADLFCDFLGFVLADLFARLSRAILPRCEADGEYHPNPLHFRFLGVF